MVEEAFAAGYHVQKESIKRLIWNMVECTLIDIVEQGRLETIIVRSIDKLENSARFMYALTRGVVGDKSLVTPNMEFVNNQSTKSPKK